MSFVNEILQALLNSKSFTESILKEAKQVMADKKIDSSDLPILMMIGLQSKDFLEREMEDMIDIKKSFFPESIKYIVFGVIYFALLESKTDEQLLVCFKLMYPNMWSLIQVNPKKIVLKSKSLFRMFSCIKK
jgi:hypothetical protein